MDKTPPLIQVDKLSKHYKSHRAVQGLSFEVRRGEVYGLLGPNGAGKTTTLRILASSLAPTAGSARIDGLDSHKDALAVRSSIGVVNGNMGLYARMTGRETLHYFGRLYKLSKQDIEGRIAALDSVLDLRDCLEKHSSSFSTGMKQKIVIARALLHNPKVILFDEATSGLDVFARRAVLDFVKAYPTAERAVVYSTHVMSEAEELCDRIGIIFKGKLIAEGTLEQLLEEAQEPSLERAFFSLALQRERAQHEGAA